MIAVGRLLTVSASIVITICLCEGALNLLGYPLLGPKRYVRLREFPPGTHAIAISKKADDPTCPGAEAGRFEIVTDKDGYLLPYSSYDETKKGSSKLKQQEVILLFLGGSTTENLYMDPMKRFPALTSHILNRRSSQHHEPYKFRSLNAGVSGNNSYHSLIAFASKGLENRPKYAFLMHAINDATTLVRYRSYWNNSTTRSLVIEDSLGRNAIGLSSSLFPHLTQNIARPIAILLGSILGRSMTEFGSDTTPYTSITSDADIDRYIKMFTGSLVTFVVMAKANDIEPVLMTQPNRIANDSYLRSCVSRLLPSSVTLEQFKRLYSGLNQATRKLATKHGVLLIDLERMLPSEPEFIYDSVHLTSRGSVMAAELIANSIVLSRSKTTKTHDSMH